MNKKEKFYITKNTAFWSVAATVICFIAYVIVLMSIELMSQGDTSAPYFYYMLRDILLVVFTILLTTLLTAWLVEVRTKNELYADAVLQDVFANPAFYREFSDDSKQAMLTGLEQELLFSNNSEIQNMYDSIKKKLTAVENEGYYFEACDYHVLCSIENGIITKQINRTIWLRSYDSRHTVHDLPVLNWAGLHSIEDHLTLQKITYNGREIDAYNVESTEKHAAIDSFCGYSMAYLCKLTEPVELYSDQNTVISISYITKVPITDNLYTCRSRVPCRRFSVNIILQNSPDYQLNAVAFGFQDTAKRSPPCVNDHEVRVAFDDWIFNKDGVTVAFAQKQQTEAAYSMSVVSEK